MASTVDILDEDMTLERAEASIHDRAAEVASALRQSLKTKVVVCDGVTGEPLVNRHRGRIAELAPLIQEVASRHKNEFIWEDEPALLIAIPLAERHRAPLVAVAPFLTSEVRANHSLAALGEMLGWSPEELTAWSNEQAPVQAAAILRIVELAVGQWAAHEQIAALRRESASLSHQIAATYEEISFIYRLTHRLKISANDEELGRQVLEWLGAVIPARGFALQFMRPLDPDSPQYTPEDPPAFISSGHCPCDAEQFARLVARLDLGKTNRPFVANGARAAELSVDGIELQSLIVAPLTEGDLSFGYLAAFNHHDDGELGTVEANLLGSIATILGIHSSNTELYRQQAELMAGIVRALTSAIDAKDPYTHGHSDRVARVAVRLGRELGCDAQTLKTIYLGGLLHDIGKIGISDAVLAKPGKLSPEEYEHIKTHVEIGYNILVDLRKLGQILPIVRHHHEAFDGTGYPDALPAHNIPWLARIVALADAFDAMGSDRPYRKGMPETQLDSVLRSGRGKQWDPDVVDAFFRIRDEMRAIAQDTTDPIGPLPLPHFG
ncbi:MAG: HD-GYP domain-containing protein [Pirellulales bacterium]|nr:HD-GYP domain-containing protein [Pirellulales bacterium]